MLRRNPSTFLAAIALAKHALQSHPSENPHNRVKKNQVLGVFFGQLGI